jgi:pilus assembly protein CpaE
MDRVKVLIVDDNQETRDGTRRLLEYEDDIDIVDFAENGAIAIEKVREHHPHVVLMDINMPVMDGLKATQRLQAEFPRTQVIIVTVQDDPNYITQALRAGAADFVTKPISSEELAEAIRRAYDRIPAAPEPASKEQAASQAARTPAVERQRSGQQGHVITVLGPKGGVGKTTVAVNLAVGLVRLARERQVLLIDSNVYFGDVGVFLNTRGQYSVVDMAVMAAMPEEIDEQSVETILSTHESGVKLLISPPNPGEVERISLTAMSNMLKYLRARFDYIIIDTATAFDEALAAAVQSSDRVIMVTQPTLPSLKDARVMLGELSTADFSMQDVILILNDIDRNPRINEDQISNFLRLSVQHQIPRDPTADEALNRGVPLVTLDSKRVPAVAPLMDVAREIVQIFEQVELSEPVDVEPERGRTGLFGVRRGG